METRYFVKFIGPKNVVLALAHDNNEVLTLKGNQFEETTVTFYKWIQSQTRKIG